MKSSLCRVLTQTHQTGRQTYCVTLSSFSLGERTTEASCEGIPAITAFLGYAPFPEPTSVAEQLKAYRRRTGWSVKRLARHLGIDECTVGNWEQVEMESVRGVLAPHRFLPDRLLSGAISVKRASVIALAQARANFRSDQRLQF